MIMRRDGSHSASNLVLSETLFGNSTQLRMHGKILAAFLRALRTTGQWPGQRSMRRTSQQVALLRTGPHTDDVERVSRENCHWLRRNDLARIYAGINEMNRDGWRTTFEDRPLDDIHASKARQLALVGIDGTQARHFEKWFAHDWGPRQNHEVHPPFLKRPAAFAPIELWNANEPPSLRLNLCFQRAGRR